MTDRSMMQGIAAALLVTVASQLFYIAVVSGSDNEMLRPLTWFTELFAFLLVAVMAFGLSARRPDDSVLWAAIGVSGVLNLLQVGMGLSMFAPAMEASETVPQLFAAILAGAFFLYFLAKLVLGLAASAIGLGLLRRTSAPERAGGAIALLAGGAAIVLNLLAMVDAKSWTFPAGAAGTAATAVLALALLFTARRESVARDVRESGPIDESP